MPSVNVVGTLLDPLGIYAQSIELRFIATSTQGQTVESSSASYFTDSQGQYNFSLEYGRYTIEVNLDIEYFLTGEVIVDAATPNPLSLTQLIDYLPVVVPPVIVPELPDWEILHRALRTATDTVIKDKIDPLASGSTYTQEIKQLFLNERLGADMAEENVLTEVGTAKVEAQTNVYADDLNHQSIQNTSTSVTNHGSMVNAEAIYDASNGQVVVESSKELSTSQSAYKKNVELTDTSFSDTEETALGTSGFTRTQVANSNAVEGITEVNLNVPTGYVKGTRTDSLKKSYVPLAGNPVNKPKIELGTSTELVTDIHSAKAYETQTLLLDEDDELQTTQERGIVAYLKKAYQRIVNNGFLSQMFTRVDRYIVENSTGIAVLTVDTINKVLRIDGRLEIANPEDFKGEPGDTIFEVFRYSQFAEGSPDGDGWHDEFVIGDNWRIFNTSVNGYVDPAKWSIPVQLNGKDGAPGDTLYFQYQYSADKVNWHTIMEDLDIWRRERVIENGAPTTAWSEGVRIRGFDGADADLTQYEYSYAISGLAAPAEWHFNFSTGDHFRRERIIYFRTLEDRDAYVPGANNTFYQATPWNNIMQIVPINGVDYGAKQATIYLYRRSTTFPPAPSGDLTWNFDDLTILPIGNLNGWSLQVPTGNENVYVALAVATSLGSEDVIGANEWNIEQWGAEGADGSDGIDGVDGKTPAVANLFCISVGQPAVEFTSVTQTMATNAMVVNGYNPQGWQGTVPSNTTPGGRVWYMTNAQLVLSAALTATHLASDFSVPSVFSQNGTNGTDGKDGEPGTPGKHGQGSFRKYAGAIPSNAQKDIDVAAIAGRAAQDGDLMNYYKDDGVASSQYSRYFFRQNGGWVESAFVVNGNSVIDGTLAAIKLQAKSITGDQISSATTLLAGVGATQAGMNGLDSGIYNNWRFWSGSDNPANAAFRVNGQGAVFASNITISGGSLNIGNLFSVTSAGEVTIQSATSGSRLVMVGDRLEVYEGSQLRVRIGRL